MDFASFRQSCKEYGLSVGMPGQDRGKSYAEWDAHRKGISWKAKLKVAIDAVIPQAKNFDDFLRLLQEQGYEVKRGKYVSFRAPGQERFTRCKTLGEAYTEEAITERIKGRFVERKPKETRRISLRIDLENSIKAQQSAGYEKWAKLHNLKQAARTLNFLTEHEIDSYPDLESRVAEIAAASAEAAAALKAEYKQLAEQKDQLQRQYAEAKRQMQEYGIIKQNVDGVLFPNHRQERDKTL